MKNNSHNIARHEFILDRTEGDKAVLLDEDDQEIAIPTNLLPKDSRDGEAIVVSVSTLEAETEAREKKAKDILNEIMNIGRDEGQENLDK